MNVRKFIQAVAVRLLSLPEVSVVRAVRALLIVCVMTSVACGDVRIDKTKFENVNTAAEALTRDVIDTGGVGSAQFPKLLDQFRREIATVRGRLDGHREGAVLDAYTAAAETYSYFLRFRLLEGEAVRGMVLLRGSNRPVASRYGLA